MRQQVLLKYDPTPQEQSIVTSAGTMLRPLSVHQASSGAGDFSAMSSSGQSCEPFCKWDTKALFFL
jgi:hypothetical protein